MSIVAFEEPQLAQNIIIISLARQAPAPLTTLLSPTFNSMSFTGRCIEPNYFDLPPVQSLNKADFNGLHLSHAVNFIPCNQMPSCWFEIEILDG